MCNCNRDDCPHRQLEKMYAEYNFIILTGSRTEEHFRQAGQEFLKWLNWLPSDTLRAALSLSSDLATAQTTITPTEIEEKL